MKVYTTDKIRNVVLLGHGGSGKTSPQKAGTGAAESITPKRPQNKKNRGISYVRHNLWFYRAWEF